MIFIHLSFCVLDTSKMNLNVLKNKNRFKLDPHETIVTMKGNSVESFLSYQLIPRLQTEFCH